MINEVLLKKLSSKHFDLTSQGINIDTKTLSHDISGTIRKNLKYRKCLFSIEQQIAATYLHIFLQLDCLI